LSIKRTRKKNHGKTTTRTALPERGSSAKSPPRKKRLRYERKKKKPPPVPPRDEKSIDGKQDVKNRDLKRGPGRRGRSYGGHQSIRPLYEKEQKEEKKECVKGNNQNADNKEREKNWGFPAALSYLYRS